MPESPFCWPVRVYIEDTDAGEIVYYANYLRFLERARTEYLRHLGFPRIETIDPDAMFVVHKVNVHYRSPARLDDELTVTASLSRIGKTTLHFKQQVLRDDSLLVDAEVQVACIGKQNRRPRRLPQKLTTRLNNA